MKLLSDLDLWMQKVFIGEDFVRKKYGSCDRNPSTDHTSLAQLVSDVQREKDKLAAATENPFYQAAVNAPKQTEVEKAVYGVVKSHFEEMEQLKNSNKSWRTTTRDNAKVLQKGTTNLVETIFHAATTNLVVRALVSVPFLYVAYSCSRAFRLLTPFCVQYEYFRYVGLKISYATAGTLLLGSSGIILAGHDYLEKSSELSEKFGNKAVSIYKAIDEQMFKDFSRLLLGKDEPTKEMLENSAKRQERVAEIVKEKKAKLENDSSVVYSPSQPPAHIYRPDGKLPKYIKVDIQKD